MLKMPREDNKEESVEKDNKKLYWVIGILLVAGIIAFILGFVTVGYNVKVCYTESEPNVETYWATENYLDLECNDVPLKYILDWGYSPSNCLNQICDNHQQVCTSYNWYGGCDRYRDECIHYACTKYEKTCSLSINNIDDTYGTWAISGYKYNYNTEEKDFVKDVETSVQPTRTGIATWDYTYDAGENMGCFYAVKITPTKQECNNVIKQRSVQKERTVMKDVQKTRNEVRQCTIWKKIVGICYDTTENC